MTKKTTRLFLLFALGFSLNFFPLMVARADIQAGQGSKNRIHPTEDKTSVTKVYVPKDLDDCFVELKKMLSPELLQEMKSGKEKDMIRYHFGLGQWLRNNWGLWGGSRLAKYFNALGIKQPDDMTGIIFTSFWRHMNGKPINLAKQIKYYQSYWKKAEEEQKVGK